jgi:hypothetical protein
VRPFRSAPFRILPPLLGSFLLGAVLPSAALAQDVGVVVGVVQRADNGAAIADAIVSTSSLATISDTAGRFVLPGVPAGPVEIRVTQPAFASRVLAVTVPAGDTLRLFLRLAARSVLLDNVVVTATELRSTVEGSSVSRISRDAIDHVQASSLADILQLVPGQPAVNPTLAGVRQSLLRQAGTATVGDPGPGVEAERANALGTAVVLDGVPVSNNANLQTNLTILNSGPNSLPPFASTAGRGLDLRQLPADNIERVEVIRGIPSARHGDLTAGAILVTSRAGQQRPELRVRANPQTLEMSTVAGWGGGPARTGVSMDGNFVLSQDDPRSVRGQFGRATAQLAWTQLWGDAAQVRTTLRARFYSVLDELRRDPDDPRQQSFTSGRDRGGRLDLGARWQHAAGDGWITELTASGSLAEQVAQFQDVVTRDIFPITGARRDTIAPGVYGRSEYVTRLTVDGRPFNGYLRLETSARLRGWGLRHSPLAGVELRHDTNRGDGRVFDPLEPPRQNYGVGDRPNTYRSIPSLTIASAYLEDRLRASLLGRPFDAQLGVRLDAVDPAGLDRAEHGSVLAPRVNAQWQLAPSVGLRAGYGVTAKAQTLSQLYPLPRYFDLVSFNYYPVNPDERLVVFTTRVVDPRPEDTRPARAHKSELALEVARWGAFVTVTAFDERVRDAFGTTRVPVGIPVPKFRALATPAGQPPLLDPVPVQVDTFVGAYDVPRNSRRIHTRGIEFTADLPEWTALRTQLALSGAWFNTVATDTDVELAVDQFIGGNTQPARVGVYDAGRGSEATRLLTSARFIHRAPPLGLVVSLLLQTTWLEDDRPVGRVNGLPVGYVDRSGRITPLTPEQAALPEFASLVRPVTPEQVRWERRPALMLVNLRLSKALPAGSQLAVFVNNALADRPLYERQRALGLERRNPPLFFGMELLSSLPFLSR